MKSTTLINGKKLHSVCSEGSTVLNASTKGKDKQEETCTLKYVVDNMVQIMKC